jgi:hypothetical protein
VNSNTSKTRAIFVKQGLFQLHVPGAYRATPTCFLQHGLSCGSLPRKAEARR